MGEARGDSPKDQDIDLRFGNDDDHGPQVDVATAVAAKSFGDIPLSVPFAKAAQIENQANMALRLKGAENFINLGRGAGSQTYGASSDDAEDRDERGLAFVRSGFEDLARQQQRQLEREREEWARTVSTVGGVSMNGDDWAKLAKRLRTDEGLQRRIMEAFMARGMTREEAEARYNRVVDVSEAMALPPSQRTDEQQELIKQADADPTFKADMQASVGLNKTYNADAALSSSFTMAADPPPASERVHPAAKPATVIVDGPAF